MALLVLVAMNQYDTTESKMSDPETTFRSELRTRLPVRVLELGTLRWEGDRPTHHSHWVEGMAAAEWVCSDLFPGVDVDIPADAHDLASIPDESFDAYLACSVYEHLQRPWLAARAAFRVLRPGGFLLIDTHQTFPIHGYPDDYWRFTDRALATILVDAGFYDIITEYLYPCEIVPPAEVVRWNRAAPAYLNICVFARKPKRQIVIRYA